LLAPGHGTDSYVFLGPDHTGHGTGSYSWTLISGSFSNMERNRLFFLVPSCTGYGRVYP
jgi:hypothetical protein